MAQTAKLRFSGIVKDGEPADVPAGAWTDGRNVQFRAGKTERVAGEAPFANAGRLFAAEFTWHVDNGLTRYWFYGGAAGVAVTDGVAHWEITPDTWDPIASAAKVLTWGDLNGVFWVNHPERGPFWWDGDVTHAMTPLPGWPVNWSVDVMRAHKNWLFGFGLDDGSNFYAGRAVWSVSAAPGFIPSSWIPTQENDAGDADFNAPTGPILDAISFRDVLFVMKGNYTGAMQYVGGQYIFKPVDVFPSMGILTTGACVEAGGFVYMLTGARELVRHDGTGFTNILYGKLQDFIARQINIAHVRSVFMYQDKAAGQVLLCYPTDESAACTEAVSIEVISGDPGIRDLPGIYAAGFGETAYTAQDWDSDGETWNSDDTIWNENAAGVAEKSIVFAAGAAGLLEQGAAATQWTPDGPALLPASVSRTGIDFDDIDGRHSIMGLLPVVSGSPGDVLSFQIGQQAVVGGAMDVAPAQAFVLGEDDRVDAQIDGRFGAIFVSSLGGQPWQLGTIAPQVARRGRW